MTLGELFALYLTIGVAIFAWIMRRSWQVDPTPIEGAGEWFATLACAAVLIFFWPLVAFGSWERVR